MRSSNQEEPPGKSRKEEDYDKSDTVGRASKKQKRSQNEPKSGPEDPTSRKQRAADVTAGTGGSLDGTTGGVTEQSTEVDPSKKQSRDTESERTRLTVKAEELMRHARMPSIPDNGDDLTLRIMGLSPRITQGPTKVDDEDPDKSATVKKDPRDRDVEKLPQSARQGKKKKSKGATKKGSSETALSGTKGVRSGKSEIKSVSKEDVLGTRTGPDSISVTTTHEYKGWLDHTIVKRLDKMPSRIVLVFLAIGAIVFLIGLVLGIVLILTETVLALPENEE